MTQPAEATHATVDVAYTRLHKSILRRRAVDQLVNAIKRDMTTLPKDDVLARRSERVLKYMRGYIDAVELEHGDALMDYEAAIIHTHQGVDKLEGSRKSGLRRIRRNGEDA